MSAPTATDSILLAELRNVREDGSEFWYARDLMGVVNVTVWRDICALANWARSRTTEITGGDRSHVIECVANDRLDYQVSPLAWTLVLAKLPVPDLVSDHLLDYFVSRVQQDAELPEMNDGLPEDVLTVSGYLMEQTDDPEWVRRNASTFGKRLKEVYLTARGGLPTQVEVESPYGGTWMVNQYSHEDAPLFNQVWSRFYAR